MDGNRIRVAGLVITRQAPSTAAAIRFFTLEDEHGHLNVTIKPDVCQRFQREAAQPILVKDGLCRATKECGRCWQLPSLRCRTPTQRRPARTITDSAPSSPR